MRNGTVEAGMYYAFLQDWVDLIPHDQLMVIKAEIFYVGTYNVMQRPAKLLDISKKTHSATQIPHWMYRK